MSQSHEESRAMEVDDDQCPVKQVDLTVPKTDEPTMPSTTFRMWVLGLASCVLLSFVNQFFSYRTQPLTISSISAQIAVVPLGHLMARTLPSGMFFKGTPFQFTMNPGPFNIKEHVLITIIANSGAETVYATHLLTAVKLFYKRKLTFLPAFLVMITTQVLGFGWGGLFRRYLVESAEMWWPSVLVQVSLFRALHDTEKRPKGGTTRTQAFILTLVCSFAYYILPGYFFLMLTAFSWLCWLAPNSVTVQQIGSGTKGLGLGSFGLDWATISSYHGSPLARPWFATANIAVGFVLVMYVVTPISYFHDAYNAKTFPIFSSQLFASNGSRYDISGIVDSDFRLDRVEYAKSGPVNMSTFFIMSYGLGFATLTATLTHVILFNGRDLWKQTIKAFQGGDKQHDIHGKLMKEYKSVPFWWFAAILVSNVALIIFTCEYYKDTLQLPWWGVLLACAIAITFTLPVGIVNATTNQQPGLNVITEYIIGYLYPERPVANMCFKVYGYISMTQALTFLADFKLGHYMKIPPRSMFMAQVVGTLVSAVVYTGTAWWLMGDIQNLCDTDALPEDSPWKCPNYLVFFDASIVWGLVGPRRIFGDLGEYGSVNWFFLLGAAAPLLVWLAHKAYPGQKWIKLIHMPVLLGSTSMMPPATAANFTSWFVVAFISGYVVYRKYQGVWQRHNYVLSGGLDAGTSFMTILIFLCLQARNIGVSWWGNDFESCPLAACPTAKEIVVDGCPVL